MLCFCSAAAVDAQDDDDDDDDDDNDAKGHKRFLDERDSSELFLFNVEASILAANCISGLSTFSRNA